MTWKKTQVSAGTICKAMDAVVAEFWSHQHSSPIHVGETGSRLEAIIESQLKGYKNQDPGTKHQKALSTSIYCHIAASARLEEDKAIANLLCGAFFSNAIM